MLAVGAADADACLFASAVALWWLCDDDDGGEVAAALLVVLALASEPA